MDKVNLKLFINPYKIHGCIYKCYNFTRTNGIKLRKEKTRAHFIINELHANRPCNLFSLLVSFKTSYKQNYISYFG